MDPLMRQWLSGLQPQKTELDWQNRAAKPLNQTIYGIVSRVVLKEDIHDDMSEFEKKYKEIHGVPPDEDIKIKAGQHLQKGGKLGDLFPADTTPQPKVTPSVSQPQRVSEIDISDFDPEKHIETPDVKFAKEHNAFLKRLDSMGIPRPPAGSEGKLRTTWNLHGGERLFDMMMDMAAHESGKAGEEMGTAPEQPKEKGKVAPPTTGPGTKPSQKTPATDAEVRGVLKPKTTAQATVSPDANAPQRSKIDALNTYTNIGFGALGAADFPKSLSRVVDSSSEPVYGLSRIGGGMKFDKNTGKYAGMSQDEIKTRSNALMAQDVGKLGADTTMAVAAIPDTTSELMKGLGKIPKVDTVAKTVTELPGAATAGKVASTTGKVAQRLFPGFVALNKYGQVRQEIENKDYNTAAKKGIEGAYWLGQAIKPNPFSEMGIGRELFQSGVGGLYKAGKEAVETKSTSPLLNLNAALDVVNVGLGAGLQYTGRKGAEAALKTGAEAALKAGGKAAAETVAKEVAEIGTKAVVKGALKQIPVAGTLVALPFAAQRAWKGDWTGAGLELAGSIPFGVGLGAQGYLAVRDVKDAMEKAEQNQTQPATSAIQKFKQAKQQTKKTPAEQQQDEELETPNWLKESVCINAMRTGLQQRGL